MSMRDPGLSEAIHAVGGVTELARRIGISQPSVSNWDKVPAERVLAVEAATGVARMRSAARSLSASSRRATVDEVDLARAQEYALLSALLVRAPDAALLDAAVAACAATPRRSASRMSALGEAAARRRRRARSSASISISSSGSGAASCCPTRSYYLTGFLHERPLARLRDDLARARHRARRGQRRAGGSRRDAVRDHGGARGRHASRRRTGAERRLFEKHHGAVDRALLRRSRTRQGGGFLSPRRNARPRVHGHRNGSLRAAGVTGARDDKDRGGDGDAIQGQDDGRPS